MLTNRFNTDTQIEELVHNGFTWLLTNFEALLPSSSLARWKHPDRAYVAIAECATLGMLTIRFCQEAHAEFGQQLMRRVQKKACPELLDGFQQNPSVWFRPLLVVAGGFAAIGWPWEKAVAELRIYLKTGVIELHRYRPDQVLEMRYWLSQCELLPGAFADGLAEAVVPLVNKLACSLMNQQNIMQTEIAYALTHVVFYMRDFGAASLKLPISINQAIRQLIYLAAQTQNIDLLSEGIFAAWCLHLPLFNTKLGVLQCFNAAQRQSGAISPSLIDSSISREITEVEYCYHSTIVTLLAGLSLLSMTGRC